MRFDLGAMLGRESWLVDGLSEDSRTVYAGDVFLLGASVAQDRAQGYVAQALERGAAAIVTDVEDPAWQADVPVYVVTDLVHVRSQLIRGLWQPALDAARWVGVTGTNGKTSVAWLVASMAECRNAYVGTLGIWVDGQQVAQLGNTTPRVSEFLPVLMECGLGESEEPWVVALEVSSIGIHQDRISEIPFAVRVLTNLSRDHLDYHANEADYFATKLAWLAEGGADVHRYAEAGTDTAGTFVETYTAADLGESFEDYAGFARCNLAGARRILSDLHIEGAGAWTMPPGRMEQVILPRGRAFIDYAHTPDAIRNVLREAAGLTEGTLWIVVGAGGDRDRGKRPMMARAALENAQAVVFSSDNPRHEDPEQILDDMLRVFDEEEPLHPVWAGKGAASRWYRITDRRRAICFVLDNMEQSDTVVVAGKGHEDYQEVKGQRLPFSDRNVIEAWMSEGSA